jgi:uncharacterized protein YlzI (FlbEa/FlbD family)
MKLFYLDNAVDTEETGKNFPQVQRIIPELDYNDDKAVYRITEQTDSLNNLTPQIEYAELKKGSLPSDFLSTAMFNLGGFMLSNRAKLILSSCVLPPHKYYSVPVKLPDGKVEGYFWLQMLFNYNNSSFQDIQNQNIIFDKSVFWIAKHLKRISQVEIKSATELQQKDRSLPIPQYIEAETLTLKKEFLKQAPDIFKIPILNGAKWVIKENVHELLINQKLTGWTVKEINNLNFE